LIPVAVSLVFGHLPGKFSALNQTGRTGSPTNDFSNRGEWSPDVAYRGDHTINQGDTVYWGEFEGQRLWWWAKFYAKGENTTPGEFAPEGGTSPWVLINSASAIEDGTVDYEWNGWNGDMENMTGLDAQIPTWRHGAEGAYAFTHDDIGAMPLDLSVKPAIDLAKDYPEIKQAWGVFVGEMQDEEWEYAREMVKQGHEVFNHSMDHTSAAEEWHWYYPTQTISPLEPSIPSELQGLTVVGTWGDPEYQQTWPFYYEPITLESELVSIECSPYWTQNAPNTLPVGEEIVDENGDPVGENGESVYIIEPRVTPKSGVEEVTIEATGQSHFVKYTGEKEGFIAATSPTWFELEQLDDYGENGWSSNTQWVQDDKGAPSFVTKIHTATAWDDADFHSNVKESKDSIDANVWSQVDGQTGHHFRKKRRDAHYGYPFDAYSEVSHDYLYGAGYTTARGGAKSGVPTPGDFFHPFRIDFDAFFITRNDWTVNSDGDEFVYPNNPHVLMGANEMVDSIISQKGYMIREFHAVPDIPDDEWYTSDIPEYWPLNSVAEGQGGWWGGITKNQLGRHYDYVQERIDDNRIVVFTPTEAVAYRITANSTESASVSADGDDYLLTTTLNRPDLDQRYWEEISVIVSFDEAKDELYSVYTNLSSAHEEEWSAAPRIQPRKMDDAGRIWSVSVNPFLSDGELKLSTDASVSVIDDSNKENLLKEVQFNGVVNNGINLSLTEDVHTVQLFDLRGRMVKEATLTSQANNTVTAFSVNNLTKGMYLLRINSQNANTTKTHRIQL
jgi:hypothetical protein